MLELDVAKRVHRIEDAYTNWYLIEEDDKLTVVDCGTRSSWQSLHDALAKIGRGRADIEAVVLTHAHFDHIGFAERARSELGVPILVHEEDAPLTRHPARYQHERSRIPYLLKPRAVPIIATLLRDRAFFAPPIEKVETFTEGTLPVPGSPEVIFTPGHTFGHCSFHLADRDALIAGDALVTLNPYTGATGPQIVARAATADSALNLATLDAISATGVTTVLTGHGDPWRGGAAEAVRLAREAGAS